MEAIALKHSITMDKFKHQLTNSPESTKNFLEEKNWITNDEEALSLLKNGFDQFRTNVALRILNDHPHRIYFNNCPQCGKLARTPLAKQCRFCSHTWHHKVKATFQIIHANEITGRGLYIVGELLTGNIKIGMKADLVPIRIPKKPVITGIEFALHREEFVSWEDAALGLDGLSSEEIEFLKSNCPFRTPIFIEEP